MKKRNSLKLLSALCILTVIFLTISLFGMTAKKEMVKKWIFADGGGQITLKDVTISFDPGTLTKDTNIRLMYFGEGQYQFGPEIQVNKTFTIFFADAPSGESVVMTFKKGEWVELSCINGYVETNHFSRYRGAW